MKTTLNDPDSEIRNSKEIRNPMVETSRAPRDDISDSGLRACVGFPNSVLGFLALLCAFFCPHLSRCLAQDTVFTYQGRVTVNGTNFSGPGQFKFALVTSTNSSRQATATANPPSGGFITVINVSFGGNGYVTAPAVTILGGGGSGATAHATLSGDAVASIAVDNPGSGYTSTPTVTIAPPPPDISYTTYWSNDGTSVAGSEPTAAVYVAVNDGLFTVTLGDTTLPNMAALDGALFARPDLQVRIWFNDGVNGFAALDPAQNLTPTPRASFAERANTVAGVVPGGGLSGSYSNAVTLSNPANRFSGDGGGLTNVTAATLGGLGAGGFWQTTGNGGTLPGTSFLGTTDNQPLELSVNGTRALRLQPDSGTGLYPNIIAGAGNSILAGLNSSTIGGGFGNHIYLSAGESAESGSVIGGGIGNYVGVTPGGGSAEVFGGKNVIGGGYRNNIQAKARYSVIGGGEGNIVSTNSRYATIPGGYQNVATNYALAAGHRAKAVHSGAFVWADSQNADFTSTEADQFLIRAAGGVGIGTSATANPLTVEAAGASSGGVSGFSEVVARFKQSDAEHSAVAVDAGGGQDAILYLAENGSAWWGLRHDSTPSHKFNLRYHGNDANTTVLTVLTNGNVGIGNSGPSDRLTVVNARCDGSSWINASDRRLKQDFAPVDPQAVLEKVVSLPVQQWSYRAQPDEKHLGPVAQDFHAAFGFGADDTSIATVDADGVALAAIQGLNQKLEQKEAEIAKLKQRLEKIERLLDEKNGGAE